MRIHQKAKGKRYYIYARRKEYGGWTEWNQTNDIDFAKRQVERVRELGFLAKLVDKRPIEVLVND
jgi:hypothetical protein